MAEIGCMTKAYSVSELNLWIKSVIEPPFKQVWIQGELSNFRPAASGHLYFSLKDAESQISAAWFGRKNQKIDGFKDGMQVLCRGKIGVYLPRGTYQIIVDAMEPIGVGSLQLQFEELKQKLLKEGLFETSRKRTQIDRVLNVAVITSPTGAALQDMIQVFKRRAPIVQLKVVPTIVQGTEAPEQLVSAIREVNERNAEAKKIGAPPFADWIVLARGGGSIEDLWCFNDEKLAYAIFNSQTPILSAVGHEIDFTISDFVSDLRAPTPSAAAEMLSQNWSEMALVLSELELRNKKAVRNYLQIIRSNLSLLVSKLKSPADRIRENKQKCDEWGERLNRSIKIYLERKIKLYMMSLNRLEVLSPLKVLERGYAIVMNEKNTPIVSTMQVASGDLLKVRLKDGEIITRAP